MEKRFTLRDLESAFNASKHFPDFKSWVEWCNKEFAKQVVYDPQVLIDKIVSMGGRVYESDKYQTYIDLLKVDKDAIYNFIDRESFESRGYGNDTYTTRYISPKYQGMDLQLSDTGSIRIFYPDRRNGRISEILNPKD